MTLDRTQPNPSKNPNPTHMRPWFWQLFFQPLLRHNIVSNDIDFIWETPVREFDAKPQILIKVNPC